MNENYNKMDDFEKKLIRFTSLSNQDFPPSLFKDFLQMETRQYGRDTFTKAYHCYHPYPEDKRVKLKSLSVPALDKLMKKMKELDGTLLVDVVRMFMETYKIF
jgi:hypothetical protein